MTVHIHYALLTSAGKSSILNIRKTILFSIFRELYIGERERENNATFFDFTSQ